MQDPSQRDKIVGEMKKELKKLQRLREQVGAAAWRGPCQGGLTFVCPALPNPRLLLPRHCDDALRRLKPNTLGCLCPPVLQVRGWAASSEVKDDTRLTDARKAVERQMVRRRRLVLLGWFGKCPVDMCG